MTGFWPTSRTRAASPRRAPDRLAPRYGVELLNAPGSEVVYLFQTGGAHSFRTIYMGYHRTRRNPNGATSGTRSGDGSATRW